MNEPNLADLAAFIEVARARSFRGAAKHKGVSPSSLSEALRRLEARLNVRLLNRTTRSVTPTEAGQRLLERLAPALAEVAAAVDSLNDFRDEASGTLRLNVPGVVADLILPSILSRFLATYPAITAEVVADENFIDVLAAGYDAGIRYDDAVEQDMIAIPIGPRRQRYVTAASKAYLKVNGTPTHPRDLLEHKCIRVKFSSGNMPAWEFQRGKQQTKIVPKGPLVANRIELQLAAARAGLGIIHGFEGFIMPSVARKELVLILDDWVETFSGPFLYYASRRHMPGPLRTFVDFVKADMAAGSFGS
jgi:DNA-binding transcriptional LysR family regulator